eukprot:gene9622-14937_t
MAKQGEQLELRRDAMYPVSSNVRLMGTTSVRAPAGASFDAQLPPAKPPAAAPRAEAQLYDQEVQIRGLRRAVLEQVHRACRHVADCEPERETTGHSSAENTRWGQLLEELQSTSVEDLWIKTSATAQKVRTEKIPVEWARTEKGALLAEIQHNLGTALKMTEALSSRDDIRLNGGVHAMYPELQRDFTDVTAPHVESFDRAITSGFEELLAEFKSGLDTHAVQAVPRFFLVTLAEKRENAKKSAQPLRFAEIAGTVEAVFLKPPGEMLVKFTRTPDPLNSWLISLERQKPQPVPHAAAPAAAEAEHHDSAPAEQPKQPPVSASKKKRMQQLAGQRSVEEREAGGVRKLLEALQTAVDAAAGAPCEVSVLKVYAKAEVQDLLVGWDRKGDAAAAEPAKKAGKKRSGPKADAPAAPAPPAPQHDGPASSPLGRCALQRIFQKWADDYVHYAPSGAVRNARRASILPYQPWLAGEAAKPAQGGQTTPAAPADETAPFYVGNPTTAGPALSLRDLQARLRAESYGNFGLLRTPDAHDLAPSIGKRCSSRLNAAVTARESRKLAKTRRPLPSGVLAPPPTPISGKVVKIERKPEIRHHLKPLYPDARRNARAREYAAVKPLLRTVPTKPTPPPKPPQTSGLIQDPGLPPGGIAGLRKLWSTLFETEGSPLQPQGHRLRKSDYTVPLFVKVRYGYGAGSNGVSFFSCEDWIYAGEVPVMLRSRACVLRGKTKGELSSVFHEEEREPGGYFISKGNERVLRMVLIARGNHPIALERASFANKGPSFTSKCVFVRSVRPSGISVPNYLYMLSSGKIILSFSRGSTWQVPLSLVVLSLMDEVTPLQLANRLSCERAGESSPDSISAKTAKSQGDHEDYTETDRWIAAFMSDVFSQVQLARHYVGIPPPSPSPAGDAPPDADAPAPVGFPSCAEHWQFLLGGYLTAHKKPWVRDILAKCRAQLGAGAMDSEVNRLVGLWAVREHVLPHLNTNGVPLGSAKCERARKLDMLVEMVRKLAVFQSNKLREEGEDGLMNQEIVTPGQLWLNAVSDAVLSVSRGLRSSLSMLGLADNQPREGWELLRPPTLDEFKSVAVTAAGREKLREVMWCYFWQKTGSRKDRLAQENARVAKAKEKEKLTSIERLPDAAGGEATSARGPQFVLTASAGLVAKQPYKMRYGHSIEPEQGEENERQKGNRQRVMVEPTYPVRFLVSTGNYTQEPLLANGSSLPQTSGWSVVVERINQFRFLEQFRATHRGKTIQEMRTTTPRRYQMDGWGFLCIVHTPDGGPCGVLNHLTFPTKVCLGLTCRERDAVKAKVYDTLQPFAASKKFARPAPGAAWGMRQWFPVALDGEILGYIHGDALHLANNGAGDRLRDARAHGSLPSSVEIVSIDPKWVRSAHGLAGVTSDALSAGSSRVQRMYPGLYLFSGPGRLSRPVKKLGRSKFEANALSWVGTQEQIFLDIAALHKDLGEARTDLGEAFRYVELYTTSSLSLTASLIPFFEMNCSPRNLFQCGMAKQTMGSSFHSLAMRNDNKLYHTFACQAALLRTDNQHLFQMDDYPNGINVVLAVAAYTGFDMEDALLINKSSVERGLFLGYIYMGLIIEPMPDTSGPSKRKRSIYYSELPREGDTFKKGQPYATTSEGKKEVWSKPELGTVHSIEVLEIEDTCDAPIKVRIIFRVPRTPVIGDKFAARHGQKGTLPILVEQ